MNPPRVPGPPVVTLAGIPLHDVSFAKAVELILEWARSGEGCYVCTPNVDHVFRARDDKGFRDAVLGARLRVPDGRWILYSARIAGLPLRYTSPGRLLVRAVSSRAVGLDLQLALYGSAPGVAQRAAASLRSDIPGLKIAAVTPRMGLQVGSSDDRRTVVDLQSVKPNVLFVALGAPKQELWMQEHSRDFPSTVMVGVGQALDVISGVRREAPSWATAAGFEWAFRVAQEPRRLGRRYLVNDPRVLAWALRQRFTTIGAETSAPKSPAADLPSDSLTDS